MKNKLQQNKKFFLQFILLFLLYISQSCFSLDLKQAYESAKLQDPTYLAAEYSYRSALETMPQARANLLPTLSGAVETKGVNSDLIASGQKYGKYNQATTSLSLAMPIINYSNWVTLEKAGETVKAAHANIYAAEQSLLLRVAAQYFNVLKALDDLNLAKSQYKAFSRHLEQSEEKFKVGLIAITDVHEAKARRDDAVAEEIAASNSYENQKEIFREIVGVKVDSLQPLEGRLELIKPEPMNIENWVEKATAQNYTLIAAKHNLEVNKKNITNANTGHFPTLSLNGSVINTKNVPNAEPRRYLTKEIGLTLSVPIFQGGKVISEQRQAAYNYQSAREEYNKTLRKAQSNTRQAFRGVLTQMSRVNAFKQSVVSSDSALKATESAFDVGTRSIVDVLDAQASLLNAQKNHLASRYDYLLETLNLKESAGILVAKDLEYINSLLYPPIEKQSSKKN